ncbi:DUF5694 domain-containing protein [Myroides marinus]|uniref:DUF5694 domain-containing protein n=1 Tax=Myroides marinus TaxID=703342 RepID=UPI002578142D|nr:DUF5694 domain-containing protein [Myroides marinus]MDM1367183.1 hypothetical protein [Myroides marinus]
MRVKLFYLLIMYLVGQFTQAQIKDNLKSVNLIPVLNMGTFHMGYTPDASTTEFDEHNAKNKEMIHEVARALAEFKPTVIIVERNPEYNETLNKEYKAYVQNPLMKFDKPNEVNLLAYELGRISGVKTLYGINHREGYNYMIGNSIPEYNDKKLFDDYMSTVYKVLDKEEKSMRDVRQLLYYCNVKEQFDALLNLNADMLTHVSTLGKSEGADEAAKYYHRNLVMYSNLNQIPLTKDDRVFILMGGSHTAFFNMWLERSPKYQLVNTLDYLKEFK